MHVVRRVVAPFLGLSAFWTCFRYQGFLVGLFPYDSFVLLGGLHVPASGLFLAALVVLVGVGIARWQTLSGLLSRHRYAAFLVALLGVLGACAFSFWPGAPLVVRGVASVSVACGLMVCFLMWTGYLATGPAQATVRKLFLVLLAYPCSVVCMYFAFKAWGNAATVALPPWRLLLCTTMWLVARQPDGSPAVRDDNVGHPIALVDLTDFFLGACAVCILGGVVIRGIIDNGISPAMGVRANVVVILSLLVLGVAAVSRPVAQRLGSHLGGAPVQMLDVAFPACWAVLAFAFLGGTLLYLSGLAETLGAYIATASCSLQLALFYVLLADKSRRRSVSFVPVMLVYGLLFWAVCWFVSYMGVSWVLARAPSAEVAHGWGSAMVFVATMAVLASGVAALAMMLVRNNIRAQFPAQAAASTRGADGREAADAPGFGTHDAWREQLDAIEDDLVRRFGLTSREAQVAVLFAAGYSLGRVAEELGITKGTAQGYSKSAYRKAGVHSKDELIDLCKILGEGRAK